MKRKMFLILIFMCCCGVVENANVTTNSSITIRIAPTTNTSVPAVSTTNTSVPAVSYASSSISVDNKVNASIFTTSKTQKSERTSTSVSLFTSSHVVMSSSDVVHSKDSVKYSHPSNKISSTRLLSKSSQAQSSLSESSMSESLSKTIQLQITTQSFYQPSTAQAKWTSQIIRPSRSTPVIATSSSAGSPNQYCNPGDKTYCKNGGLCRNVTDKSSNEVKPVCFCSANYYGSRCESLVSENKDDLYKQLTYAFGGTTAFLFIIIAFIICCRCREKSSEGLDYIQELDEFKIGNKRASAVITNPNVLQAFDVQTNGTADEKPSKDF